ncbi:MAG: hypothetical protein V7L22_19335 [Nostoc sp.]
MLESTQTDLVCAALRISTRTFNSAKISDRLAHHQIAKSLPVKGLVVL